jgi:hypothetical protein
MVKFLIPGIIDRNGVQQSLHKAHLMKPSSIVGYMQAILQLTYMYIQEQVNV